MGRLQPSLRDLCKSRFEPGSELPGYCQISLREAETVKNPDSRGRPSGRSSPRSAAKQFIRWLDKRNVPAKLFRASTAR